jgi:IclR family KDG regulon transcriptional repressor
MNTKDEQPKKNIQSIVRGFMIIDYLMSKDKGERLTTISRDLCLNKSTVFTIVSTLEILEVLSQDHETGKYHLGLKLLEYGLHVQRNMELITIAKPYLQNLSDKYGETVHLAVLSGNEVIYLDKVNSPKAMQIVTHIGQRLQANISALGKAILSYLPEDERDRIIDSLAFTQYTPYTICNKTLFLEKLREVKERGYATDSDESEIGLSCIGAPIWDSSKKVIAAVSLACPTSRMVHSDKPEIISCVMETAAQISHSLGYKGNHTVSDIYR